MGEKPVPACGGRHEVAVRSSVVHNGAGAHR